MTRKAWKSDLRWPIQLEAISETQRSQQVFNHTSQVRSYFPYFADRETTQLKSGQVFEAVDKWLPYARLNISHSQKEWPHLLASPLSVWKSDFQMNQCADPANCPAVTGDTRRGDEGREQHTPYSSQQFNQVKPSGNHNFHFVSNPFNFSPKQKGTVLLLASTLHWT